MFRTIRYAGLLSVLLGLILLPVAPVPACATVGGRIRIAEESAIILWDAKTKTEHFIRRAAFRTDKVYNFGFLVPTPSQPELGEVKDDVFSAFEPLLKPEVIHKRPVVGFPLLGAFFSMSSASKDSAAAGDVRVLHAQRVAGHDAVVLEADSPVALNEWLGKNGYSSRPALEKWLAPYIAAKWKITAFKFVGDPQKGNGVNAPAVRMSFKTDRPFYPYREPEDASEIAAIEGGDYHRGRTLRVNFLGNERVSGEIGDKETQLWPGVTRWSGRLDENTWETIRKGLGKAAEQLPQQPWLTIFDDRSSPRPGTDEVYFEAAASQSEVRPEPIIYFHENNPIIPLDVVALILLVGLGVFLLIRRIMRGMTTVSAQQSP